MAHALHAYRHAPHSFFTSHVHYDVLMRQRKSQKQQSPSTAQPMQSVSDGEASSEDESDEEESSISAAGEDSKTQPKTGGDAPSGSASSSSAAASSLDEKAKHKQQVSAERARALQQREKAALQMVCAPVLSVDNLIEWLRDAQKQRTVWIIDIRPTAEYVCTTVCCCCRLHNSFTLFLLWMRSFNRSHFAYAAHIPFSVALPTSTASAAGAAGAGGGAAGGGVKPDSRAGGAAVTSVGAKRSVVSAADKKSGVVAGVSGTSGAAATAVGAGSAAGAGAAAGGGAGGVVGGVHWLDRAGAIAEHVRAARGLLVVVGVDEEHAQRVRLHFFGLFFFCNLT